MRQLTSLDAQFLAVESARIYGHVAFLGVYDPSTAPGGRLDLETIRRLLEERLHLLPPLTWRLVPVPLGLDLPYWVEDPDFDLDFHIRESAIPSPGSDRQLAETVARMFARPLDRSRPLWELYLIHGLPEERVAVLTKVHHAAIDGVSGAEILGTLFDLTPEGEGVAPNGDGAGQELEPARGNGEREPSELEMLVRGVAGIPRQSVRALAALSTTVPNLGNMPGMAMMPGAPQLARASSRVRRALRGTPDGGVLELSTARAPKLSFNGKISAHRSIAFGSVPLPEIKALKNELGITVNDVVVGLCAGALRAWLEQRDELPGMPLVAMIPTSVRTKSQKRAFGNKVSTMIVPVPTDVADPRKRLERAHEILKVAKERHKALPASLLTDATNFIPPAIHARAARVSAEMMGRLRSPINVVISNVPGPPVTLYCAGAELQANYPVSVVTDGAGLNFTVLSYRDSVDFGITADRASIPDAWPLLEAIKRSLEEFSGVIEHPLRLPRRRPGGRARTPSG
jgi:diacylglycerol O-acyltransferase / wax synthase